MVERDSRQVAWLLWTARGGGCRRQVWFGHLCFAVYFGWNMVRRGDWWEIG